MTEQSELQLWERQPEETDAQFKAFTYYLNEPMPRTIDRTYRRSQLDKGNTAVTDRTRASGSWRKWQKGQTATGSRRNVPFTWQERVAAFDNFITQQFTDEQIRMRTQEMKRELRVTDKLLSTFNDMLANLDTFSVSTKTEVADDESGVVTVTETIALNVKGLMSISRAHKDITNQRRLALNLPDRVTETQIGNAQGRAFEIKDAGMYDSYERAKQQLKEKGYLMNNGDKSDDAD